MVRHSESKSIWNRTEPNPAQSWPGSNPHKPRCGMISPQTQMLYTHTHTHTHITHTHMKQGNNHLMHFSRPAAWLASRAFCKQAVRQAACARAITIWREQSHTSSTQFLSFSF